MKIFLALVLSGLTIVLSGFASAQTTGDCNTLIGSNPPACLLPSGDVSGKQTTSRWYTGLVWELGGQQRMTPDIVFGFRSLTVKNINEVSGGDASLRVKIKDASLSFDSVRLAYAGGKPSVIGNVGVGYSFTHSSPLATVAVQGNYLRLSTDYLFTQNKFQFFGEINTLKKPEEVSPGQLTCPSGYSLTNVSDVNLLYGGVNTTIVPPAVNGKTCLYIYG
ncbi:MAG: hypothetical protein ACOYB1_10495 [Limnohabitans sp.]